MIFGRATMHTRVVGHPLSSVRYLVKGIFPFPFIISWNTKKYIANTKRHHSDDEMFSIMFFIQQNILSSLAKEQFDKIVQLFIAKKPPIFI